jgi:plastocyanin
MSDRPVRTLVLAAAALTVALVGGCSSSSSTSAGGSGGSSPKAPVSKPASASAGQSVSTAAATITIKAFGYKVSGAAAAGSMIEVRNDDPEAHTVTADENKAFDVTIQGGKTAMLKAPSKAGTYKFHCTFHSNMHGALTVAT